MNYNVIGVNVAMLASEQNTTHQMLVTGNGESSIVGVYLLPNGALRGR